MRLRQKTLIVIVITVTLLCALFYWVARAYVIRVFDEIEQQQAHLALGQVHQMLKDRIETIRVLTGDWAAWDDTYQFVETADPAYVESNLTSVTFSSGQINLVGIYTRDARPVYEKFYSEELGQFTATPESFEVLRRPFSPLVHLEEVDSAVQGLVLLDDQPFLIAAQSITTSQNTGPVRGTIVMGRYLNADEIAQLAARAHLPLRIVRADLPTVSEAAMLSQIEPMNEQTLLGRQLVTDVFGEPAIYLEVEMPRPIHARAEQVRNVLLIGVLLAGLVMGLVLRALLHTVVERRLEQLGRDLRAITRQEGEADQVQVTGDDEIAQLGTDINGMLYALEHAHRIIGIRQRLTDAERLLSALPAAAYMKDRERRYVAANAKFCELCGVGHDSLMGKRETDGPYQTLDIQLAEEAVYAQSEPASLTEETDGRIWAVNVVPLCDAQNRVEAIIGIKFDVTNQLQAQTALKRNIQELEEANRAKDQFLANMSHEIRTPMNGVIGMLNLLALTQLDEEQQGYVNTASASSDLLMLLLNDILDLSRLDSGMVRLERRPSRPAMLLEVVVRAQLGHAQAKGLQIDVVGIDDPTPKLLLDPTRIQQVLHNLINNAIKFTHEGTIRVALHTAHEGNDDWRVRFEVTDTGIGIPPDLHSLVFDRFTQADPSTTRRFGGSGLGLAISKRLVEVMGGEIGMESEQSRGSCFWFEIPARAAQLSESISA